MIDPFGRKITYLRVSVTDRCDFRCFYCMAEEMTFVARDEVLTLEELDRMISAFIGLGVRKVRLTGGEPLVRKNISSLIRSLGRHRESGALDELTLTTNGSQLEKYAGDLVAAGVKRINVSLDSLDNETFRTITRGGRLAQVLAGIEAASDAGLKIKINTVALRSINQGEVETLARWCGDRGFDLTFIETMPLGNIGQERVEYFLPLTHVREMLDRTFTLTDIPADIPDTTDGPSRYVHVAETETRIGFITPLTENFCARCNRMRLTCTGTLYMCLGQNDRADLRNSLRASEGDGALIRDIIDAVSRKPKAHDFVITPGGTNGVSQRHMNVTGG